MRFMAAPDPNVEGEVWVSIEDACENVVEFLGKPMTREKLLVSNRGRVQIGNGPKTRGSANGRGSKYSSIGYNGNKHFVHTLVFIAFNKGLPTGVICHNDSVELCADGRYRNWAEDLRDDTQSNNIKESHAVGAHAQTRKRKREEFDAIHNQSTALKERVIRAALK